MAGSVVKWWKQKILQGYSKLSLLQECPTDCEELIYHNNCASSSFRLPSDLLLNNNKNNNYTTKSLPENSSISNLQNHCKENQILNEYSLSQSNEVEYDEVDATFNITKDLKNKRKIVNEISEKLTKNSNRIKLEEFKCDVSVSEGKNQPLQFSFTFYDLDGHHNKITKDDITGIVYTIYESIGQNLIVPHCGSKTINVRLTVNPENNSKLKKNRSIKNKNNRLQKISKNQSSAEEDTDGQNEKDKSAVKNLKILKNSKFVQDIKNEDFNKNLMNRQIKISAHDAVDSNSNQCNLIKENIKTKILRKTPKKKSIIPEHETRQRSLSVGNETRWTNSNSNEGKQRKIQGKCWNHTIKREELIDIIKESMEKNRLCFQSKPQATVTPIRQRSNTVTNSETNSNNKYTPEINCYDHQQQQAHQHHHHGSHHIPIYHQQLPINPAILQTIQNSLSNGVEKPRNHLNLCGYDSHLHAKFCSSANSDSYTSPPHLVPIQQTIPLQHSPVYQSISQNFSPKTYVQNSKHFQQFQNQHKRHPKKLLNQQIENDGYQRLEPTSSTPFSMLSNLQDTQNTKLNTHILSSLNSELSAEEKINRIQYWLNQHEALDNAGKCNKKDLKNYDNLLYARLSEKLLAVRKIDKRIRKENKYNNTTIENNQNLSDHDKLDQEKFRLPEYNTDCENLINDSSDNDTMKSNQTKSNGNKSDSSMVKHRYVHEHYHHHYHHFENTEDLTII